jgi:DNA-binding LacI/PurR family transcriptional regulator
MSVAVGEAKKVLFAMCMGLRTQVDPDNPTAIWYLSDFDVEPYLSIKNKKAFRPMHKHLLDEIQRRFVVLNIPADERFKRSNKNKSSMNGARTWLKDHPLKNWKRQ